MLKSDLPRLTPFQYGDANELRTECYEAIAFSRNFPNSKPPIVAFFEGIVTMLGGSAGGGNVADGDSIGVTVNGTAKGFGTAHVSGSTVSLELGPDSGVVLNGGPLVVSNSAGTKSANSTVTVDGTGNVTAALAATAAIITNGQVVSVGGVDYTFTVSGGVVTAITHVP